jgi:hypothetical protein
MSFLMFQCKHTWSEILEQLDGTIQRTAEQARATTPIMKRRTAAHQPHFNKSTFKVGITLKQLRFHQQNQHKTTEA